KNEYVCGKNAQNRNAGLLLDIMAAKASKSKYRFLVTKKGSALTDQKIVVSPLGGEEAELKTNNKGTATIKTKSPGIYLVSIDWIDITPGTFKGKQYETVRHRLDYTFTQE